MAIRLQDIQNILVTEDELNLLQGLTADASQLNGLSGYTGSAADLNTAITVDGLLTLHEATDFTTAHPISAGSLDGLLLVDSTVTEAKLAFDVATEIELQGVQTQVDDVVSDTAVQQTQIDNLFAIVIPGQGDDLADAIQQTIDHIELISNAHAATAISYGNEYALSGDIIAATTTSLILPLNITKHFRAGETIRVQDDVTAFEDMVLTSVNFTTGEIIFPVTVAGFTTANNGIVYTLSEDTVQEGIDRSYRTDGEKELKLREGLFSGTMLTQTLTADRTYTFRDVDNIIGNPDLTGNALKYLRANAGETDVEWVIISAEEVTYDPSGSILTAVELQAALDEFAGIFDTHQLDTNVHFTEASISHLNIQDIGTNSHADIDTHIADDTLHRIINDLGTSVTELWSADKISSELTTHNHALDDLWDVNPSGKTTASVLEWDGVSSWIIGSKGEVNTASNLAGEEGLFANKVGSDLQFKSLTGGSNISLISDGNNVIISTSGGLGEVNTASNVGGEKEVFKQKVLSDFEFRTIKAGTGISLVQNVNDIEISAAAGAGQVTATKTQIAHGFSLLNGIYHDGTNWLKAQANDGETLAEYIVVEVADLDNFIIAKFGQFTIPAHGKTIGEHHFLNETVAGESAILEPSAYSNPLFYVEDANTIHVEVYRPSGVSEVAGAIAVSGIIVGDSDDVTNGIADFSSIQAAHDGSSDGDKLTLLNKTFTENLVLTKKIFYVGAGNGTLIDGTVQFSTGSAASGWQWIKFNDNITIDLGVAKLLLNNGWINPLAVITDNSALPGDSIITLIED